MQLTVINTQRNSLRERMSERRPTPISGLASLQTSGFVVPHSTPVESGYQTPEPRRRSARRQSLSSDNNEITQFLNQTRGRRARREIRDSVVRRLQLNESGRRSHNRAIDRSLTPFSTRTRMPLSARTLSPYSDTTIGLFDRTSLFRKR